MRRHREMAEHVDASMRWRERLVPQDGGRGRELRTTWTCVRWFAWDYGHASRRFRKRFVTLTWHLFGTDRIYKFDADDDVEKNLHMGVWPLHLAFFWTTWERPIERKVS